MCSKANYMLFSIYFIGNSFFFAFLSFLSDIYIDSSDFIIYICEIKINLSNLFYTQNLIIYFPMKKIYSLVVLFLLACVNVAHAQRAWDVAEASTDEIKAGLDFYYVLQEGQSDAWSKSGYLFCGLGDQCSPEVTTECIYSFVQVDEKVVGEEKFPIYVLKNRSNDLYLANGNVLYVRSKNEAFKFTARKGKLWPQGKSFDGVEWIEYSNAVETQRCPDAENMGTWVLCSPDQQRYIGFYTNPSFMSYIDTNNWIIKEAKEKELPASEKFYIIYDKYIGKGMVDLDTYPVGNYPGCISQEVYDEMSHAYDMAQKVMQGTGITDAQYDEAREAIEKAWTRCENERVMVGNGYYLLVNGRSQDMAYDNGSVGKCWNGHSAPDAWTVENAKYIWQVVETGEDDKFVLKNWGTGRYLGLSEGTSKPYKMVSDSTITYTAPHYKSQWFLLQSQDGNQAHNDAGGTIVLWNSTGEGNWWRFNPVPADTIAKLSGAVKQNLLNTNLTAMVSDISSQLSGLKTMSGLTFDGNYASNAKGLVSEFEYANATETQEGKPEWAFDGKLDTYYHTLWHADKAPKDDYHWIQVDLGKEVQEIYVKFSYRHNNNNGNPSRYAFVAAADGDDVDTEAAQWHDTLATDTAIYAYSTKYPAGVKDSTTCVQKVNFGRPVQHVRFVVTRTRANQIFGYGPCWHVSELRFYDAAESVENPLYASVPKGVKDALDAAIAKANEEIAAEAATQETIDALETAIENFWEAYPDPEGLTDKVEALAKIVEKAVEDADKLGYFQEGAKQPMLDKITEIKAKITNNSTAVELDALEKELDEAFATFNGKLNVPANNTMCRIQSTAPALFDNGDKRPQFQAAICSANADSTGTPVWGYGQDSEGNITGKADRFNTLWVIEKSEAGFAFRNLANGLYMDNKYEGLSKEEIKKLDFSAVGYSVTPKHFQLETAGEPGSFVIVMKENEYINLQPSGNVVHYSVRDDAHAPFEFVVLGDDESDYFDNRVDAAAGAPQIVTLPYATTGAFFEVDSEEEVVGFFKLEGSYNGALHFTAYDEMDEIPAGTPVLVVTPKFQKDGKTPYDFFNAPIAGEDPLALEYEYAPVKQNGMVSAPKGFEIEPGFGIIYKGEVVISEGGEDVYSGSGFFNNEVPAVETEGDYQLVLKGVINGAGTAVENVELVKNVANDVYTISGVKVRSNVKTSVATKNLPKGIYIVGGKKVVVK